MEDSLEVFSYLDEENFKEGMLTNSGKGKDYKVNPVQISVLKILQVFDK